jgi:hypothetical protein
MLELAGQQEVQARFGDRFSGMQLTHVEQIHWPVWLHTFCYEAFESVSLDPLEEGLLLLVQAGVESVEQLSALLGCSERYAREMVARLGGSHTHACVRLSDSGTVHSSFGTASAIRYRARQSPVPKSRSLIRDAIFDSWLSYGDVSFSRTAAPTEDDGAHAWLEAEADRTTAVDKAGPYALTLVNEPNVESFEVSAEGVKEWVTLWLGCYQPSEGSSGRFLLFNPSCEDSPLSELSVSFEELLRGERLSLYFGDDTISTASLFWQSLSNRLAAEQKIEELKIGRDALVAAQAKLEAISEPTDTEGTVNIQGKTLAVEPSKELLALRKLTSEMSLRNDKLQAALDSIPRTQHIESSQHPEILIQAIDNAQTVLILICPWIRMSVLRPLLPRLDRAMGRGCLIYIGYGMPKNPHHPDNSDEEALAELRKREKSGMLRLCHINTHEKVIVQDDQRFVTSSFNFLSYAGGDRRRESGTLWLGNVGTYREKFLLAFPKRI